MQNQRAGLFLVNGVVYIAWGSHCDIRPCHGWLMGYQESTLQQVAVFNPSTACKPESGRAGLLSTSPTSQSSITYGYPGATPVVSANGSTNGLLWMLSTVQCCQAVLHVYDAANLLRELYNSTQNAKRDQAGIAAKLAVPAVANGKVYIGTSTELDVYGLLPQP
jgi:hypothetical protein